MLAEPGRLRSPHSFTYKFILLLIPENRHRCDKCNRDLVLGVEYAAIGPLASQGYILIKDGGRCTTKNYSSSKFLYNIFNGSMERPSCEKCGKLYLGL